ncbi:MAG: hypothetical protein U0744_16865, partial [Gemmataceae bacterium]
MFRFLAGLLVAFVIPLASPPTARSDEVQTWSWYQVDGAGQVRIHLHVFWSNTCSHCAAAHVFLNEMKGRHPWLQIYAYETHDAGNLDLYRRMAQSLNRTAGQIPAFFWCGNLEIGYDGPHASGARLERSLQRCYEAIKRQVDQRRSEKPRPDNESSIALALIALADPPPANGSGLDLPPNVAEENTTVVLPFVGETSAESLSLPALTAVLALCDSVNPCAFFVLLFLLSLMIHAHSRWRMAVVGGTFVFFSGLVYFLFMAAWLNLFMVVGHLRPITWIAGLLAVVAAVINVKDFFFFRQGPTLSIPEDVKPGLFQRMTQLIGATRFASMLAGTVVLAALVNMYELLCTSGFPMIYTRVLTLRDLSLGGYYAYLVAYNVLYVLPLAVIVGVFAWKLGARKMTEYEGRVLKLLSGLMMFMLGASLLIAPALLSSLYGAVGLLVAAISGTAIVANLHGRCAAGPRATHQVGSVS